MLLLVQEGGGTTASIRQVQFSLVIPQPPLAKEDPAGKCSKPSHCCIEYLLKHFTRDPLRRRMKSHSYS